MVQQLVQIMEVATDPKAAAIINLKEGLHRVLNAQADIPQLLSLGLDDKSVVLKSPESDHEQFENCMAVVCGLNQVCDALRTLRPIESVPYVSAVLLQVGFEEIMKPVIRVLEDRVDASSDSLQKIEDHLAFAKLAAEFSVYFHDAQTPNLYDEKAKKHNGLGHFLMDVRNNTLTNATRLANGLTPLLEPYDPDITVFDEGRFVLSSAQTQEMYSRIQTLATAGIGNPRTLPAIADMLADMVSHLPPELDDVSSQLRTGLFDKMSANARVTYVTDLAELMIQANNPDDEIDNPILNRYATTIGSLKQALATHGSVAAMMGLAESHQVSLDLVDRNPS